MKNSSVCDICLRPRDTTGAILRGKFGQYCPECKQGELRQANAQKATYDRDRDREDHRKDMLQPWLPNGKINVDFARAYPDKAKDYYNNEELSEVQEKIQWQKNMTYQKVQHTY